MAAGQGQLPALGLDGLEQARVVDGDLRLARERGEEVHGPVVEAAGLLADEDHRAELVAAPHRHRQQRAESCAEEQRAQRDVPGHRDVGNLDGFPALHGRPDRAAAGRGVRRLRSSLEGGEEVGAELVRGDDDELATLGIQLEDPAGVGARQLGGVGGDGVEHLAQVERRAHRAPDLPHGVHLGERPFEGKAPLLELGGALLDPLLQRPVQVLELGEDALLVPDVRLEGPRHLVERAGELADLVPRLDADLLVEEARGDLLCLLGEPVDGPGDPAREAVEDQRAQDQEGRGDAPPEAQVAGNVPLDAREGQAHGHAADHPRRSPSPPGHVPAGRRSGCLRASSPPRP